MSFPWRRAVMLGAGVLLAVLAYFFAMHIPRTLAVFIIAAFIAAGVRPIVKRLEAMRVPKAFAIAIVFVVLILLVVVTLLVIVPLMIVQIQGIAQNLPAIAAAVEAWTISVERSLQMHFPQMAIPTNGIDLTHIGTGGLQRFAGTTLGSVGQILVGTATGLFVAFASLVLSIFFLLNDATIADGVASLFPASRRPIAHKLLTEIAGTFGSYISGQVIVSAITGLAVWVLSAVIGFKFALLLGVIVAISYAIPMLGSVIGQAIAVVLCAPQGWWMVLWVQVIIFVVERISDNVLVPKIMGDSVGVSPIAVMFAVFAGGELFGIPGLLLGIPAAALIKILWRYFVDPWLSAQLERR
ncbi:MAG: AI-2E family transporter [Candidatus Eremiobacteraeota bacterium]|nr:AI-2E family transporter [Candidatus Eremiobacteraeota bacterium]NNM92811.1 AI-2E family transporter [Candidatus Eremiobacteraeota bacterium]